MRRWGDGQRKHLTGKEHDEIYRRIGAAESFAKVAEAIGCSTKSIVVSRLKSPLKYRGVS
jgi:hypothetical protein